MTLDEFMALDVNDRNALVAEKIVGLIACGGWRKINLGRGGGPVLMAGCDHEGRCYPRHQAQGYTTSIADAWEVVEKLDVFGFNLERTSSNGQVTYWAGMDTKGWENEDLIGSRNVDSPALAICIAALRAVGAITD